MNKIKTLHRVLAAAGLARVYEHMAEGPFAIVSAARDNLSERENESRMDKLKSRVRDHHGFLPATGVWMSGTGPDHVFVPGVSLDAAIGLAREFDQPRILWADRGRYWLYGADGDAKDGDDVAKHFWHLDPGLVPPEVMTQIKRYPFVFRGQAFEGVAEADRLFGNWALQGRQRFYPGFSDFQDPKVPGKPFFYWNEPGKRLPYPRFGFGVENPKKALEKDRVLHGGSWSHIGSYVVFLPLNRVSKAKSSWKKRRPKGKPSIASMWRKMVSKPGSMERRGQEKIVDKFWIDADGELIHHGMGQTHQDYALEYLRERGEKMKGLTRMNVDNVLLGRGWIRGQIYSFAGLGLQGKQEAIEQHGHKGLELLPKPRRVYVSVWPDPESTVYSGAALKELFG